jgi:hypothetical protein
MGEHRYIREGFDPPYVFITGGSCSAAPIGIFNFKQSELSEAEQGIENEQRIWESIVENHPFGRNGVK